MKQKLTKRSFTEGQLVAANDVLSSLLWNINFLNKQGYYCDPTLNQENKSDILLETNLMEISSKWIFHISTWFCFIKDNNIHRELNVKKCSTDDILEEFTNKPLQGSNFNKFIK